MAGGHILRFPYSTTVINQGSLSNTISNEGALQLSIYNPKVNETIQVGGENMAVINVYEGNYGYDLMFTISDVDGNPFNLSGATISFRTAKLGASALTVDAECTIVVAGDGTCVYTTVDGDFDVSGMYAAELQIEVASKVYTIGDMQVNVIKNLPRGC